MLSKRVTSGISPISARSFDFQPYVWNHWESKANSAKANTYHSASTVIFWWKY